MLKFLEQLINKFFKIISDSRKKNNDSNKKQRMVFEIFFNSFSKEIKIFLYKTINKERKKQRIQIYKNSVQITSCTNRKYITINIRIKHVSVKYSDHVQPTSYDLCLINTDSRVIIIILCIHMYKNIDYTPALC